MSEKQSFAARLRRFIFKMTVFRLSMIVSMFFLVLFLLKEEKGWDFGIFDLMELKVLDLKFHARGMRPASDKVAIAAIDEKSLEAFGRWPWNRQIVGELVDALHMAKAKVVGFDVAFTDEDRGKFSSVVDRIAESVAAVSPGLFRLHRSGRHQSHFRGEARPCAEAN